MLEDTCQTQSSVPSLFASKQVQQARKELWDSLLDIYEQEATIVLSDDGIVVAELEKKAVDLTNKCLASSQLISEPKVPKRKHTRKVKNDGNRFSFQNTQVKSTKSVSVVRKKVEQKRRSISKQTTKKKTKSGKEYNPKICKKSNFSTNSEKTDKEIFFAKRNIFNMEMSSDFIDRNSKRVFCFADAKLVANICSCGFLSSDFIF